MHKKSIFYLVALVVLLAAVYTSLFIAFTSSNDSLLAALIPVIVVAINGIVCLLLAKKAGRSMSNGFIAGLIFGPFAILYYCAILLSENTTRKK